MLNGINFLFFDYVFDKLLYALSFLFRVVCQLSRFDELSQNLNDVLNACLFSHCV